MKTALKNTWIVLNRKEKKEFTILIVLDVLISIIDILCLVLLLRIVQFYIQPGQASRLSFLPGWLTDKNSVLFIAIFFILFGLKNIAAYLIGKAHYKFIGGVAVRITRDSLTAYQQSSFEEFVRVDSSVHIRKIALQPFDFSQHMLSGIQQIITQLSLILLAVVAIIIFNAKLFLLLLVILLPPVVFVFYFIRKRMTIVKKNIVVSNERSYKYLLDALKGYVEANVYGRNDFFLERFIHIRTVFSTDVFETISLQNMPSRIIEIFAVLGLFILVGIARWTGNDDSATLITIGAFMAAAYKIIHGVVKIVNLSGQMRAHEFAINEMAPSREKQGRDRQPAPTMLRSLELKNISFQYSDQTVLKDVSFAIGKGDFAGITGASGKGKTTILNILLGFLAPNAGEVLINDHSVNTASARNHWPLISYARQQSFFIHDTILRNITLEEKDHDEDRLQHALSISGLNDFIAKFPEGIQKVITENGKNISGGQQQRIVIARALYKNADLVLLDEPFNELDETSTLSLLDHFRHLASTGKMIIMITHDKKSLSYCNKVISLDEQQ